jgi:hypothetical protein
MLEQSVIDFFKTQGPWALLFVVLLFWVLRENARREENYQGIIHELSAKFDIVETIRDDVKEIKGKI